MTNNLIETLQEKFPNFESVVVFTRDPKTGQLFMSPLFKLPEKKAVKGFFFNNLKGFKYARGLQSLANEFHKIKFKS